MTLRHFEIFRAVAQSGSFTRAARMLFITQSAVSHAIREMEDEAGTPLFDRMARQVRLTRSGALLMEKILPILAACENLKVHVGNLEKEAPIRLASSITIASFRLPEVLRRFQRRWPGTPVETEVVSAANAMGILRRGGVDMALIEGAPERLAEYHYERFSTYDMVFICGANTDIPAEMTVEELLGYPLLLREKGSAIRDTLDGALLLAGFSGHPAWTSVNSTALLEAAADGLGIALLPEMLVKDALRQGRIKTVKVQGLALSNEMLMVWHREKYVSEPLRELMGELRSLQ